MAPTCAATTGAGLARGELIGSAAQGGFGGLSRLAAAVLRYHHTPWLRAAPMLKAVDQGAAQTLATVYCGSADAMARLAHALARPNHVVYALLPCIDEFERRSLVLP